MELNNDELELITTWFELVRQFSTVEFEKADFKLAAKMYDHIGYAVPTEIAKGAM